MFRFTGMKAEAAPECYGHPGLSHLIPQQTVGDIKISTSANAHAGRTTQDVTGIELPNPNLAVYQNILGDYAAYPLAVPLTRKVASVSPPQALYQVATRRPWDITHQQFAKQINKRKSFSYLVFATIFFAVAPFCNRVSSSVETGPRPGYGLTSHHGAMAPAPIVDRSYAK